MAGELTKVIGMECSRKEPSFELSGLWMPSVYITAI